MCIKVLLVFLIQSAFALPIPDARLYFQSSYNPGRQFYESVGNPDAAITKTQYSNADFIDSTPYISDGEVNDDYEFNGRHGDNSDEELQIRAGHEAYENMQPNNAHSGHGNYESRENENSYYPSQVSRHVRAKVRQEYKFRRSEPNDQISLKTKHRTDAKSRNYNLPEVIKNSDRITFIDADNPAPNEIKSNTDNGFRHNQKTEGAKIDNQNDGDASGSTSSPVKSTTEKNYGRLENKAAFVGDMCSDNLVKVNGECIKED